MTLDLGQSDDIVKIEEQLLRRLSQCAQVWSSLELEHQTGVNVKLTDCVTTETLLLTLEKTLRR